MCCWSDFPFKFQSLKDTEHGLIECLSLVLPALLPTAVISGDTRLKFPREKESRKEVRKDRGKESKFLALFFIGSNSLPLWKRMWRRKMEKVKRKEGIPRFSFFIFIFFFLSTVVLSKDPNIPQQLSRDEVDG